MATEHTGLLSDSTFWVLLATIIFSAVVWAKGRAPLLKMLDARSSRIKADLEEAARLKEEAQQLLADMEKKHRDAVSTAQKIIDAAQESALRLQSDANRKLEESLKLRESQLMNRISRAESAAVQELRNKAADIATQAAEILLHETLAKRGAKLVDESISELPEKLN